MSRTDKDRPYRVRTADARILFEQHHWSCEHGRKPCDLDAPGIHTRCHRTGEQWGVYALPPCRGRRRAEYRDWTRPDRQRVRRSLRGAKREYNTHGDTELQPPPEQHRQRGKYDRW